MKNRVFPLTAILIVVVTFLLAAIPFVSTAHAEMVSYIDENGKVHHVDTKYMRVPDRYADQIKRPANVRGSINQTEVKFKKDTLERIDPAQRQSGGAGSEDSYGVYKLKPVVLFVKIRCDSCRTVEGFLKSYGISYQRLYIDDNGIGENRAKSLNIEFVPAVVIENQIVYGSSAGEIAGLLIENGYKINMNKPKPNKYPSTYKK